MFSKILFLVSAGLIGAGLAVNTNARQRAARAKDEQASLARHITKLEADATDLRHAIATVDLHAVRSRESIAQLRRIEFAEADVSRAQEAKIVEGDSLAKQEQNARDFRSRLVARYAPFYYRAGLTDQQIDRFETIQTEHWQNTADLTAVAEVKRLKDGDAAVAEIGRNADETRDAEAKELLGGEQFRLLQDYERALPARDIVSMIAERLYYTPAPLDGAQAEKLTQLLASQNAAFAQGSTFILEQTNWDEMLQKVPTILSEKQRAAFMEVYRYVVLLPVAFDAFGEKMASLSEALSPATADAKTQ